MEIIHRTLGGNIEAQIEGSTLTLSIDLSKSIGLSKSRKNTLVASTNGNITLPDGSKLGLNIYRGAETSGQG